MSVIFRESPEVNFRALRDMGLAAWWGSSLMNLAGLTPASEAVDSPKERYKVLDAGLKGSAGLTGGAVTAYLVGTSLVHFKGKPLGDNGLPRWITEGVESLPRAVGTALALATAITAKNMRGKAIKLYEEQRGGGENDQAEALRKQAHALHAAVPAIVGWLMYSHLKEDMRETNNRGGIAARIGLA